MVLAGLASIDTAAAAGSSSAFLVADVPVDATADSGVHAREAARADGERRAFTLLLKRLTRQQDWDRLPSSAADHAVDYVLDMVVDDEHPSATRYIGTYTFRFSPKATLRILGNAGISAIDTPSKPVVILPVLTESSANGSTAGATPKLWEDDNPWRQAWKSSDRRAGLVPWINLKGSVDDASIIDAASLVASPPPTPDKLAPFSMRYNGGDVVIAAASETDAADKATLQINLTRYAAEGPLTATTSVEAPKPDAKFYKAGVAAAEIALESLWKDHQPVVAPLAATASAGDGNAQTVIVAAPIAGPHDWAALRDKLALIPGVQRVQLIVMSKDELRLSLKLAGSPQSLIPGFQQQNLTLSPGDGVSILTQSKTAPTP